MITKTTPLKDILELGRECKRAANCCRHGSGALAGDDLKNISGFLKITEKELKKEYLEEIEKFNTKRLRPKLKREGKPYGPCVFLDGKDCKIHHVKPLECKVGNCSKNGEKLSLWFMLNYFVNKNDPESIRQFSSYLKTGGKTLPGGKLEELVPEKNRLKKILSYKILK